MKFILYAIWMLLFLGLYFQTGVDPNQPWIILMVITSFVFAITGLVNKDD